MENREYKTLLSLKYPPEYGCFVILIPLFICMIWVMLNQKIFWSICLLFIVGMMIEEIYRGFLRNKKIKLWMKENSGMIIFFYPHKKILQDQIKRNMGEHLHPKIKQMYYHESKIVGDIDEPFFIKNGLSTLNRKFPKHPRLIQLQDDRIIELIDLKVLDTIERMDANEVNRFIVQMNAFVQ